MLNRIIAQKKEAVEARKQIMPLSFLKERIAQRRAPLDFTFALGGDHTRLIAEVKKTSPSRGVL
jgi:indole-3-glycerol phosphate synthase